uniref:Uncharacterized protein n=1 Tax=Strigamia maritima TaxID=126957 RepID=T1JNM2_STRMM
MFDLFAVLLYSVSGCCSIYYYSIFITASKFQAAGIAFGVMAIMTSIVYLVDVFLPYKDRVPSPAAIRRFAQKNLVVWK